MKAVSRQNPAILPAPLTPGATIAVAAPAGAFDRPRFERGLAVLQALGFRTVIPDGLFEQQRYLAGTDAHRADLLNRLFSDESVQAIMCARGGFGSLKTLSRLDFDLIRENPKIFGGFSDISVLLSVIFEKTGLITFHAPVITALAEAGEKTTAAMTAVFTSTEAIVIRASAAGPVRPGRAEGVVRGGNLASLCQLTGTPYQPDFRGSLLLLEDINEAPYRIDRMLSQMRLAGCLEGVTGVLLGSFDRCGDIDEIHEIVRHCFSSGVPILGGLPVGHNGDNLTLPLGLPAALDADNGLLQYRSPALAPAGGQTA